MPCTKTTSSKKLSVWKIDYDPGLPSEYHEFYRQTFLSFIKITLYFSKQNQFKNYFTCNLQFPTHIWTPFSSALPALHSDPRILQISSSSTNQLHPTRHVTSLSLQVSPSQNQTNIPFPFLDFCICCWSIRPTLLEQVWFPVDYCSSSRVFLCRIIFLLLPQLHIERPEKWHVRKIYLKGSSIIRMALETIFTIMSLSAAKMFSGERRRLATSKTLT